MKNIKRKIACLLTTFIFLFTYISTIFYSIDAYADSYKEYIALTSSKPKSGGFSSGSSKSYSKPKSTIIKPDSGGFSIKPNSSSKNSNSNSNSKPDSGSFTTKPKNNNSSNKKYDDYDDYGGNSSSRPIFGGSRYSGYYGGYSPFQRMFYGFGMGSWIMKVVSVITAIVIIYIIFDYIRNRGK